jgi:hypothetical protein
VHQRQVAARQEAVVDEAVLLDGQARVATLEVAGTVAGDAVTQRQVLGPRRRADRVGLDEAELLDRPDEGGRLEQRPADGISAQVVECGRRFPHPSMMPRHACGPG